MASRELTPIPTGATTGTGTAAIMVQTHQHH